MNHRLTIAAALAVILASVSLFSLIDGAAWYVQASGAVLIVALAGTLTRLSPLHAAIGATVLAVIACVPLLAAASPYLKATGPASSWHARPAPPAFARSASWPGSSPIWRHC